MLRSFIGLISLLMLSLSVHAVNLSADIEQINHKMLQPVQARIIINDVDKQVLATDMQVRLASVDIFNKMQTPRVFFLTKLDFAISQRDGDWIIDVTSYDLVKEPYLTFIVELVLPGHRIYRQYTLLFDAPSLSSDNPVPLPY